MEVLSIITPIVFSSKNHEWETPSELFHRLHNYFQFTLDPCATKENAKCEKYFTKEDDGLSKSWAFEKVFMNPPYGREISKWIDKASNYNTVCLLPSRTDVRWQHDIVFKHANMVCFIKGRLKFGNSTNSAPFPSQLVVFGEVKGIELFRELGEVWLK